LGDIADCRSVIQYVNSSCREQLLHVLLDYHKRRQLTLKYYETSAKQHFHNSHLFSYIVSIGRFIMCQGGRLQNGKKTVSDVAL